MVTFTYMTSQFTRGANVGNLVIMLVIVLSGVFKPAGATMV